MKTHMILIKATLIVLFLPLLCAADAGLIYHTSYEENKKTFLDTANKHLYQSWALKNNPALTTDLALYTQNSEHMVVISSGLHGIEGYIGSSVQRWLMNEVAQHPELKTDLLLIHAMNPWGMKAKRRVNENNVDLNRNFLTKKNIYELKNENYNQINSFLNPSSHVELNFFNRLGFIIDSLKLIYSYSLDTLRKSILLGQYENKKGLYYGGNQSEELQAHIDTLLEKDLAKYKSIIWIDIHTGYGERAKLHLLANDSELTSANDLVRLFPSQTIDFGNKKNFYKTEGDLTSYLTMQSTPQRKILALAFEYGTLDSQKTLGSIESLRRMVIENQGFQVGFANPQSQTETEKLFRDMFFPQEEDWKVSILKQTKEALLPLLY